MCLAAHNDVSSRRGLGIVLVLDVVEVVDATMEVVVCDTWSAGGQAIPIGVEHVIDISGAGVVTNRLDDQRPAVAIREWMQSNVDREEIAVAEIGERELRGGLVELTENPLGRDAVAGHAPSLASEVRSERHAARPSQTSAVAWPISSARFAGRNWTVPACSSAAVHQREDVTARRSRSVHCSTATLCRYADHFPQN